MPKSDSYYLKKEDYKCVRCPNKIFTSWNEYENHHVKHAVTLTISGLPVVRLTNIKRPRKFRRRRILSVSSSESDTENLTSTVESTTNGTPNLPHHESEETFASEGTSLISEEATQKEAIVSTNELENSMTELVTVVPEIPSVEYSSTSIETSATDENPPELNPGIVQEHSAEDPLGLNLDGVASGATGSESPPASFAGNIRVLPFETMVSPSVVKAGNDKMFTPLRAGKPAAEPIYENGAMVAIPEQTLAELNVRSDKDLTENPQSSQESQENNANLIENFIIEQLSGGATQNNHSAPKKTTEAPKDPSSQNLAPPQALQQQQPQYALAVNQQLNQGAGSRAMHQQVVGNQQRMPVSYAPAQAVPAPFIQTSRPAMSIRVCGPTTTAVVNGTLRPVASFTVRAQLPPLLASNAQNAVRMSVNSMVNNTGQRPGVIHQNLLRPLSAAQIRQLNLQPPVQMVRPELPLHNAPPMPQQPFFQQLAPQQPPSQQAPPQQAPPQQAPPQQAPPQQQPSQQPPPQQPPPSQSLPSQSQSTNSYTPVQQATLHQIRPSTFVVIRPQHPTNPTMVATPARSQMIPSNQVPVRAQNPPQATSNQVAIRIQNPPVAAVRQTAIRTQTPVPGTPNTVPVRIQMRPQGFHNQGVVRNHMASRQAGPGVQVAVRTQRPHRPGAPLPVVNQQDPLRTVVRQPVRAAVPSGGAIMGDVVRQAAPAPATGQQPVGGLASTAQKRPLTVESGLQCAQPKPKARRVSANITDEVSITNRSAPNQETYITLLKNPNITLVPAKDKESSSSSEVTPQRTEPALVDLTDETSPPAIESTKHHLTCQVCNQSFKNSEMLKTHLITHIRKNLDKKTKSKKISTVLPNVHSEPSKPKSLPALVATGNGYDAPTVEQADIQIDIDESTALRRKQNSEMSCIRTVPLSSSSPSTVISQTNSATTTSTSAVTNSAACPEIAPSPKNAVVNDLFTFFEKGTADSLVLPFIDVSREGVLESLESLGITQCIPVSNLSSNAANRKLVIPIMSVASVRNSLPSFSGNVGGAFRLGSASAPSKSQNSS